MGAELETNWSDYLDIFERYKDRMRAVVEDIVSNRNDVDFYDGDDYGYIGSIGSVKGDGGLCITLRLVDSEEPAGYRGNFILEIVEDGGTLLYSYAPFNFTPECWVCYCDVEEWGFRMVMIESDAYHAREVVKHWLDEVA